MPKPKPVDLSIKEKIVLIKQAGLCLATNDEIKTSQINAELAPLPQRIQMLLGIIKSRPQKATTINYLIMYDIEDDKVRKIIAKYLEQKGCVRIQKSVFMANSSNDNFVDIHQTLKDINEMYDNNDTIILVPVNVADVRSMKLIGKNVQIDILTDPPNTLFF